MCVSEVVGDTLGAPVGARVGEPIGARLGGGASITMLTEDKLACTVAFLGRTVTWMIQEGGYTPAANFLSSRYPLDRVRMEKMWQIINDPKAAKKADVSEFVFCNNEGMIKPFDLSVEPSECNHPFGRNGKDCKGSNYDDIDVDDAKAFCSEVRCGNSGKPSDFGDGGRPATPERADLEE